MSFGRDAKEFEQILQPRAWPGYRRGQSPCRIVTLAFLSGGLPRGQISQSLAYFLAAEAQTSVALVILEAQPDAPAHGLNGTAPPALNGEFKMPADLRAMPGGPSILRLGVRSEPPSCAGITSLIDQLGRAFKHVLIAAAAEDDLPPWLGEFMSRSGLAYVFLESARRRGFQLDAAVQARCHNAGARVRVIGCLREGESAQDGAPSEAGADHLFVRACPRDGNGSWSAEPAPALFRKDLRRLAREISGRLVGLALSSGAAKGFAHVGVIQVLEENGIEVDAVAGASMGAYVGSLWACGCDGTELERLSRELEKRRALWTLIDPVFPPRQGFLRGYAVKRRLMRTLGEVQFADLVRPFRALAANLTTLERVVFSSGEVATAVHASIAVPGICVPVTIDGQTYVDGGIVDPLPVDVLREMGIGRVIAVDVIPTPDRIRASIEARQALARQNGNHRWRWPRPSPLDRNLNYFARGNLFEILVRCIQGAQIRVAEASCAMADVVLRPATCDETWLDYRNPGRFIALGRQAAESHLEEIKALVAGREAHEPESSPQRLAAVV